MEAREVPEAPDGLTGQRRGTGNDAAEGGAFEPGAADELADGSGQGAGEPGGGGKVRLADDAPGIGEAEVGVGVADVE